jgi:hemerythrin-like domain-containing protein
MKNPRQDLFTSIHKAIRRIIYDVGLNIQIIDFRNEPTDHGMLSRLQHVLEMLQEHGTHEEKIIFAATQAFEPKMVQMFMEEHVEIHKKISQMHDVIEAIKRENDEGRIEKGARLSWLFHDLVAFYMAHMNKEEETLLPLTWKYFTDEQLSTMRTNIQRNTTPERYREWLTWLFPSLNNYELIGLFTGMKLSAPQDVLEKTILLAKDAIGQDRWKLIQDSVGV